jgi:RNA polymerase primary sigma factor
VHIEQRERKLARVERELTAKLARDPSDDEVAAAAGFDVADVHALREARRAVTSLDVPVGDDGSGELGDFLPAEAPEAAEEVARRELERTVAGSLSRLTDDERSLIELRFGLADGRERTLEAAGRELGVTRVRARQLEDSALARLRGERALEALREAA